MSLTPTAQGQLHRLRIACRYDQATIADGASIACNGVCLTVVASGVERGRASDKKTWFEIDAAAETLAMTTAKHWRAGTQLNLERALKIGDELGGHIVTGHVDAVAQVVRSWTDGGSTGVEFVAPRAQAPFIAAKGSLTIDGVSLTINSVADAPDGVHFSVNIIPHTAAWTTLGDSAVAGISVNIEIDVLARYLGRMREALAANPDAAQASAA